MSTYMSLYGSLVFVIGASLVCACMCVCVCVCVRACVRVRACVCVCVRVSEALLEPEL